MNTILLYLLSRNVNRWIKKDATFQYSKHHEQILFQNKNIVRGTKSKEIDSIKSCPPFFTMTSLHDHR